MKVSWMPLGNKKMGWLKMKRVVRGVVRLNISCPGSSILGSPGEIINGSISAIDLCPSGLGCLITAVLRGYKGHVFVSMLQWGTIIFFFLKAKPTPITTLSWRIAA